MEEIFFTSPAPSPLAPSTQATPFKNAQVFTWQDTPELCVLSGCLTTCKHTYNRVEGGTNSKLPATGPGVQHANYLNNRVFLSRNYRPIVAPRKFDVLKTNICLRSKASRANMLVICNITILLA